MISLLISARRERAKYASDECVQTRKSAGTAYRKRAALLRNRDHRRLRFIPQALASLGSAVCVPPFESIERAGIYYSTYS